MKKTFTFLASLFALLLLANLSGCTNEQVVSFEENSDVIVTQSQVRSVAKQESMREKIDLFKAKIAAGQDISGELEAYILEKAEKKETSEGQGSELLLRSMLSLINPDDYNCDDNTNLTQYISSTIEDWGLFEVLAYYYFGDIPTYDAIFYADPAVEKQVFGLDGEFNNQINRTFKNLKRFWQIESNDILLVAMKGETFKNKQRLFNVLNTIYYYETEEDVWADVEFFNEIFTAEEFWGGDHPMLTFNAFSVSTNDPFVQNRIIMGDGMLLGFAELGLSDVAPQAILTHEYAHQVQFKMGYFDIDAPDTPAEATRRTELMADAYTGYYLTHKRGASLNWKRVQQYLEIAYNIGDCGFSSSGHHGTPEQRMAAAEWGYQLAADAHKQGHILPLEELYNLFQNSLDEIINCPACITSNN